MPLKYFGINSCDNIFNLENKTFLIRKMCNSSKLIEMKTTTIIPLLLVKQNEYFRRLGRKPFRLVPQEKVRQDCVKLVSEQSQDKLKILLIRRKPDIKHFYFLSTYLILSNPLFRNFDNILISSCVVCAKDYIYYPYIFIILAATRTTLVLIIQYFKLN